MNFFDKHPDSGQSKTRPATGPDPSMGPAQGTDALIASDVTDLLDQLATAQAEVEAASNRDLNKAVGAASHAMLLRQAQETIREIENRYHRLVQFSPGPLFIQCEGKFAAANDAALIAFGATSADQLLGKDICDFVHPDFLDAVKQRIARVCQGEVQKRIEQKLRRLNGTWFDAEVAAIPITYHGKAAAQVIVRDITERRRSEEALKRSELWFREVWNHSSDGMRLVNEEGIIVMANDAFCDIVGKPRHEIEGKSLGELYCEEERHHITVRHRQRFSTRTVKKHLETQLTLWNGRKAWLEVANSFIELGTEQPLLLGVFRDVTTRKKVELRGTAFSKLGEQLNSATTKEQAARIISSVANELFGWDACSLQLYSAEQNLVHVLLNVDLINGERVDVPPEVVNRPPTPYGKKTIEDGPQLVLRNKNKTTDTASLHRFGDTTRQSASLMFVPIRSKTQPIGILSIQSYTPLAYDADDLNTLQALADHCSGALARLQADAEREQSEKRNAALTKLVHSLSAAETQTEAAKVIVDLADELFGWDSCNIDLYFPGEETVLGVIVMDTINGQRVAVPNPCSGNELTTTAKRVIQNGAELILRDEAAFTNDTVPFGSPRPSASIMNVPIRHGEKTIGVFSIQSYTRNAYKQEDLVTLQALAEHCGGALDRLRSAEKLRASEQRFQILSKAAQDAIWDWDLTKDRIWWNEGFSALFGYNPKDVDSTLQFWTDRIHDDDRRRILDRLRGHITSGQALWTDEYRFRRGDGSFAHIFDRGYVIHDATGKPVRMIGVIIDISERKRIEQRHAAFSKLGQQLSMATTPLAAAEIIAEITDNLFKWEAFTLALYYPEHNLVESILSFDTINGKRVPVTFPFPRAKPSPRTERIIQCGAQLILREASELSPDALPFGDTSRPSASIIAVPIRHKQMVLGMLQVHSYVLKAFDEQDLAVLQMLADHCGGALERIRAEEALRTSELRFHSIWENSVDGMRLTDGSGTIIAVNQAYCKLAGMERQQLEGRPFSIVYGDAENAGEALKKYRKRFEQRIIEKTMTRRVTFRNGKSADLEDTNSFIEIPGQQPLLLALFRDITQQRRLEEELRHSQKMESVGQLAGGIAHDFNNILTVVQGHASLLLLDQTVPPKVTEAIHQISHVADRAANLTRQLLTFSRKQVMQPKNLDLNDIVSNMTKLLQRVLGEDISLQVNFVARLPLVHADPGMIEQILMNLAVNSRDAMPRGGKLFIQTSVQEISGGLLRSGCRPGKYVSIQVIDTGVGIPPEILPKIFEPFFTTKDVGKGTGLGLATVYGIVAQHGGWIDVQSTVGKGTRFDIYLPAQPNAVESKETKPAAPKMKGGQETILLVEDEDEVRNLARVILERLGYTVLQAASGVKALSVWQEEKHRIDLVLTDIVMPDGLSGRELADRLRADNPALKIIFCSGYSTEMVGQDSILHEGKNFLQKPYTPQKLASIVRNKLDNQLIH